LIKKLKIKEIEKLFDNFEFDKILNEVFAFIDVCNEYVQENELWKSKDKKKLYELVESIKKIGELLLCFIPESAEKIVKQFSAKKIVKEKNLFEKIEFKKDSVGKVNKDEKIEGIIKMDEIEYNDFKKVKLKVGTIKKVEDIEGADKLYNLSVDLGDETRTICAGIKEFYSKNELKGKQIIVVANLKARTMRGIESNGMLLAASNDNHSKVVLVGPEKKVDEGFEVS